MRKVTKNQMKKLLLLFVIIALLLPAGQALAADAAKEVKVNFAPFHFVMDGVEYATPNNQLGFLYINDKKQSLTYVPFRFVATMMNKTVVWDAKTLTVTVNDPKAPDWEGIRKYLDNQALKDSKIGPVDKALIKPASIKVNLTKVNYVFNGKSIAPSADAPGILYNGSLYVPLRFMYESLGYVPKWDAATYSITASSTAEQIKFRSIVIASDRKIADLFAACTDEMLLMVDELKIPVISILNKKITDEQRAQLLEKGEPILAKYKAELDVLLGDLTKQLEEAGFTTEFEGQYREKFDALEQQLRKQIGQ